MAASFIAGDNMSAKLTERQKNILKEIVDHYTSHPEPISSRAISKSKRIKFSPATIRNELMELEENGYLEQIHSSSGRIPTDTAYKFYINYLMELEKLSREEEEKIECIRKEYEMKRKKIKSVLKKASRTLASIAHLPGLSITPSYSNEIFNKIEMILIDNNRVLILLLTQGGIVKNIVLKVQLSITQHKLNEFSELLNKNKHGISFEEMEKEIKDNAMIDLTFKLKREVENIRQEQEIMFEGASNLMKIPEFHNSERLERLFKLIEEKNRLVNVLNQCIKNEGIKVLIGNDLCEQGLNDFSMILSSYSVDKNLKGTIGILGPTRVQYPKVITLVSRISEKITELLSDI